MTDRHFLAGLVGLIGALIVGFGEGFLQLAPGADYTDPTYSYFANISEQRLWLGHALSILGAPLYLIGYWHLSANLAPNRTLIRRAMFGMMAYAFMVGAVWLGQRYFLAETVQAIADGTAQPELLEKFAAHNEPFINVLRIAVLVFSVVWIWLIATGQSNWPRWMAIFSPVVMLASIFIFYAIMPEIGSLALPTAMNTAHFILFALSLFVLRARAKAT